MSQTWEPRDPLADAVVNPVYCGQCNKLVELRARTSFREDKPVHESCGISYDLNMQQSQDRLEEYLDFQASRGR